MTIRRFGKYYKYRSLGNTCSNCTSEPEEIKRLREIIEGRKVWFASPESFNDPYDCLPSTRIYDESELEKGLYSHYRRLGETDSHIAGRLNELLEATPQELDEIGKEVLYSDVAIFSMTTLKNSSQQWAYYADSHSGICLEFDIRHNEKWTGVSSIVTWGAFEVVYHRTRINCNLGQAIGDNSDEYVRSLRSDMTQYKSPTWAHEEEVRLINSREGLVQFPPSSLTGVIFGARIKADNEALVRDMIENSESNPTLYRSVLSHTDFENKVVEC